jgi:hypothetical protein
MDMKVGVDPVGDFVHGLGYPASTDPDFTYCAETLAGRSFSFGNYWWLDSCAMTGGSSGGPWVQNMDETTGTGLVIGVNSWGYSSRDGMASPLVTESEARCLANAARDADLAALQALPDGSEGIQVDCYSRDCITYAEYVAAGVRKLRGGKGDSRKLCHHK